MTIQAQIIDLVRRLQRELGMAVIWITHDLGVVAGMCERVNVMYAGLVIETAAATQLFARPQHPYTIGLLGSIPRLDASDERLQPIPKVCRPIDVIRRGCPFRRAAASMSTFAASEVPQLVEVERGHRRMLPGPPKTLGGEPGRAG